MTYFGGFQSRLAIIVATLLACLGCNKGTRSDLRASPVSVSTPQASAAAEAHVGEVARPYDENADAQSEIDLAVQRAKSDGRKVLVIFGGNWCKWCRRLEHTLQNDAQVRSAVESQFHVVHVDTGARRSGKNAGVAQRYGDPVRLGLPAIAVLGNTGDLEHVQETGSLEEGEVHSPAKVLAFLTRFSGT